MEQYDLTEETLKKPCSDAHILDIRKFIAWSEVGPRLKNISQRDIDDIERDERNQLEKRNRLLSLWVDKNGNDATYYHLINAMLAEGKREDAEKVLKLLSPKKGVLLCRKVQRETACPPSAVHVNK